MDAMHGFSQSTLGRPAAIKALAYQADGKPEMASPLLDVHYQSVVGDPAIPRAIVVLGYPIGPAAISGLVSTLVVDAVDAQSGGTLAHVGQEGFKGILPRGAHCYPPTAVTVEAAAPRIEAAPLGLLPREVCPRLARPVASSPLSSSVSSQASATLSDTLRKTTTRDGNDSTAVTDTTPGNKSPKSFLRSEAFRYRQPAEAFSWAQLVHVLSVA